MPLCDILGWPILDCYCLMWFGFRGPSIKSYSLPTVIATNNPLCLLSCNLGFPGLLPTSMKLWQINLLRVWNAIWMALLLDTLKLMIIVRRSDELENHSLASSIVKSNLANNYKWVLKIGGKDRGETGYLYTITGLPYKIFIITRCSKLIS